MNSLFRFPLQAIALLTSIAWDVVSLEAQTSCSFQSGEIAVCIQNITATSIFASARLIAVEEQTGLPHVWDANGDPLPAGHPFYEGVAVLDQNMVFCIRSEASGAGGKIFQAARVALPPVLREGEREG